jgi:hypothetical protein
MRRLGKDCFIFCLSELSTRAKSNEPAESASTELPSAMAGVTVNGSKGDSISAKAPEVNQRDAPPRLPDVIQSRQTAGIHANQLSRGNTSLES